MQRIFWFFFVLMIASYLCGPVVDPDLWWHTTVGRWILANFAIPHVDMWNMFGEGKPWRAYSWLHEILYASAEKAGGAHGLLIVQFVLIFALVSVLTAVCISLCGEGFFGTLLGTFAALATFNHLTLRPQTFTWILFAGVIWVAQQILDRGWSIKRGAWLVALFCLWANSHITTFIGLAAVGSWMLTKTTKRETGYALGAGFVGTLLTPYLGGEWLTFLSKTGHPLELRSIAEFQAANIMQYSTGFLILSVVLFFVLIAREKTSQPALRLLGGAGLSLAGLAVVKFLPLAIIYWCLIVAVEWRAKRNASNTQFVEAMRKFEALVNWPLKSGVCFVFFALTVVNAHAAWRAPLSEKITPVSAVDYIQKNSLPHPILNDFGTGGYLMYRFSDAAGNLEHKVPIDGRTNVMGADVWKAQSAALNGKYNWRDYLEMVKPETILWRTESPFTSLLIASGEWCRVFRSGTKEQGFSVFVKQGTPKAVSCEN